MLIIPFILLAIILIYSLRNPVYTIRQERMNSTLYYMIYCNGQFYERWNTFKSATTRLAELKKKIITQ